MGQSLRNKGLNRAQQVVVSIGWGVLLYVVASYLAIRLAMTNVFGADGWFNYAPNGATLISPEIGGGPQTAEDIVDVVAVGLWVFGSTWLFRTRTITADLVEPLD